MRGVVKVMMYYRTKYIKPHSVIPDPDPGSAGGLQDDNGVFNRFTC